MVAGNVAAIMRGVLLMIHAEGRLELLLKVFILSGRRNPVHSACFLSHAMIDVDFLLVIQLLNQVLRVHRAIGSPV